MISSRLPLHYHLVFQSKIDKKIRGVACRCNRMPNHVVTMSSHCSSASVCDTLNRFMPAREMPFVQNLQPCKHLNSTLEVCKITARLHALWRRWLMINYECSLPGLNGKYRMTAKLVHENLTWGRERCWIHFSIILVRDSSRTGLWCKIQYMYCKCLQPGWPRFIYCC